MMKTWMLWLCLVTSAAQAACSDIVIFLGKQGSPDWTVSSSAPLDPDRSYFVQLTYFKPRAVALPEFMSLVRAVNATLAQSPGYLGHSLFANLPTHQFWTLSIWESEAEMQAFFRSPAHVRAMQPYRGQLEESAFPARLMTGLSSIPDTWSPLLSQLLP
jgi:heme-degrading monooxygenase HmoA